MLELLCIARKSRRQNASLDQGLLYQLGDLVVFGSGNLFILVRFMKDLILKLCLRKKICCSKCSHNRYPWRKSLEVSICLLDYKLKCLFGRMKKAAAKLE